jgi:Flp pilus assembly protein TadD
VSIGLNHGVSDRFCRIRSGLEGVWIVRATPCKFKQLHDFQGFQRVRNERFFAFFGLVGGPRRFIATSTLAACLLLSACAAPLRMEPAQPLSKIQSVQAVAEDQDLPLKLIGAEYALQRNDLATAAKGYAEASMLSADAEIAEQATRLALAGKRWDQARSALQRWQSLDPKSAGVLQSRAWIALSEGDIETAFAALAELAARSGDNRWRPVAQVLVGASDRKQATKLLERLATPERLGDRGQDWIAMSQLAFKLEDKDLAERLCVESVKRFGSSDAFAWSAQLALDRGDKDAARARFAEALKRDPESLRVRTGYAALLAETGDNAAAARVLAKGKQSDVVYGARAAYVARTGDKALIGALYREIGNDKSELTGKRMFLLGQLAELIGEDAKAIEWYRQLPEEDEHWFAAGMRIVVLSDKAGDRAQSSSELEILRLAAGPDAREGVDLYLLEAEMLLGKSEKHAAMAVYSKGLDLAPDDPRLLYSRAMLLIEMDDLAGGERDLRKVLAGNPDSAEALNALGYTLVDRTDRLTEATALIERAIKIKPDEPAIIDSYGWAQYRLGRLDEAERLLRKAYASQPDSEVAAHLGEVLWVSGDHEEARQIWEQGRKKDAGNKVLIETIKRLAS